MRFGGRLPHELRIPLTYFQTLVDFLREEQTATPPTRNGDDGENEDVVSVDVDELIRKGKRSGFGVEA